MEIQTLTNEFLQETYHKINHPSGLTVYVLPKEGYQTTYANVMENPSVSAGDNPSTISTPSPYTGHMGSSKKHFRVWLGESVQ